MIRRRKGDGLSVLTRGDGELKARRETRSVKDDLLPPRHSNQQLGGTKSCMNYLTSHSEDQ